MQRQIAIILSGFIMTASRGVKIAPKQLKKCLQWKNQSFPSSYPSSYYLDPTNDLRGFCTLTMTHLIFCAVFSGTTVYR